MALEFEPAINLTTFADNPTPSYVNALMIANEPDNNINQFYVYDNFTATKNAQIAFTNYTSLIWRLLESHITLQPVLKIGVKNFPQLGAMAFCSYLYEERSIFLCPVFVKGEKYTRPGFTITENPGSLTFHMRSPKDIRYACWRIVLRAGDIAFEYISYTDTLTVDPPYLTGTYDCYCIGYVDEGQAISDDSVHYILSITGTGLDPLDKFKFYTKAEIDAMLGNIAALLDSINGEVI